MFSILILLIIFQVMKLRILLLIIIILNTFLIYLSLKDLIDNMRRGPISFYKSDRDQPALIIHKYPQPIIKTSPLYSYTDYCEVIKKIIDIMSFNLLWVITLKKRPQFDLKYTSIVVLCNYLLGVSYVVLKYIVKNKKEL